MVTLGGGTTYHASVKGLAPAPESFDYRKLPDETELRLRKLPSAEFVMDVYARGRVFFVQPAEPGNVGALKAILSEITSFGELETACLEAEKRGIRPVNMPVPVVNVGTRF